MEYKLTELSKCLNLNINKLQHFISLHSFETPDQKLNATEVSYFIEKDGKRIGWYFKNTNDLEYIHIISINQFRETLFDWIESRRSAGFF